MAARVCHAEDGVGAVVFLVGSIEAKLLGQGGNDDGQSAKLVVLVGSALSLVSQWPKFLSAGRGQGVAGHHYRIGWRIVEHGEVMTDRGGVVVDRRADFIISAISASTEAPEWSTIFGSFSGIAFANFTSSASELRQRRQQGVAHPVALATGAGDEDAIGEDARHTLLYQNQYRAELGQQIGRDEVPTSSTVDFGGEPVPVLARRKC